MKKIILTIVAALVAAVTLTSFTACGKFSLQTKKLATDEELEEFYENKDSENFFKKGLTIKIEETVNDFGNWGEESEKLTATVKMDSKGNISYTAKSTLKTREVKPSGTVKGKGKASEKLIMIEDDDDAVYYFDTQYKLSSKTNKTSDKQKIITGNRSLGYLSGSVFDNIDILNAFFYFDEDYYSTYYYFIDGDDMTVIEDGGNYMATCVLLFDGKEFKEAQLIYKSRDRKITITAKAGKVDEIKAPDKKDYKDRT